MNINRSPVCVCVVDEKCVHTVLHNECVCVYVRMGETWEEPRALLTRPDAQCG